MTSYKNEKEVSRLAEEYGMLESDVRQMLAIESGEIQGDVRVIPSNPIRTKIGNRLLGIIAWVVTLGHPSMIRWHRSSTDH